MARRKKKKPKKAKKTRSKVASRKRVHIPEEIKPYIAGSIILFLALFIVFSYFGLGGVAGKYFLQGVYFLVGRASYVLPFVFLIAGIGFFLPKKDNKWLLILAIFLFIAAISGAFAMIDLKKGTFETFRLSGQGGVIGSIVAWPLMRIFGLFVPWFLFLIFAILSGVIVWHNLSLPKFSFLLSQFKKEERFKKETVSPKKISIKKVFTPKIKVKTVEEPTPIKVVQEKEPKENKTAKKPLFVKPKEFSIPIEDKDYKLPPINLLESDKGVPSAGDIRVNSEIIRRTLENFGIPVEMHGANIGPTVTQYTLKPAEGIKLSRITALSNNLALALAAHPIRIEAPIPGKPLVGIEVPNKTRTIVRLKNLLSDPEFHNSPSQLTFVLGRDVMGKAIFADLARMPHLLVAGATGTGKTICLNSIILSFLYRNTPKTLRFILVDPKRVEFNAYGSLPHVLGPVIYDPAKTIRVLRWLIEEMERRFEIFGQVGARNIYGYNSRVEKNGKFRAEGHQTMPYIVLIIDELADLMAARARDIESGIVRLAQKARATGIHLILATQRPSVEVITGLIKANIIARIAFQVASQVDSRTILDTSGAEKLLGNGDMLFISASVTKPKRIQGAYVSEKEVERVVKFIVENQSPPEDDELVKSITQAIEGQDESELGGVYEGGDTDPLYEEAKRLVIETRKASASFLQRKLRVGYARAARLLDMLEERGIVGPAQGAKPREVYIREEEPVDYSAPAEFPPDYNEDLSEEEGIEGEIEEDKREDESLEEIKKTDENGKEGPQEDEEEETSSPK